MVEPLQDDGDTQLGLDPGRRKIVYVHMSSVTPAVADSTTIETAAASATNLFAIIFSFRMPLGLAAAQPGSWAIVRRSSPPP